MIGESLPLDQPMKEQVLRSLHEIIEEAEAMRQSLFEENCCILSRLETLKKHIVRVQTMAASFYLHSYLSAYTPHYVDLSLAAKHLAERRHGALIIIERNDSVDHLLHHGIPIGAKVSHTLLETIFYPGNPLHDGGTLIRYDEIVSAGNILPLAQHVTSGKKLGTRHRAAIGLTEQIDALVIVVSEETGTISFAINGQLYALRS
ncbi:sporulation-specific diadenylate cyclase CdaS [Thermaerobacillus caldiproteolyticus]|uniref:sporulation-specific diadenylate cyclase CdaS n=1 Tax=Thermaerobacillus caldiproteolyticus TaxID=247480 RepID=UPI00188D420B|nr:sporulation-specific diadenylate cyclase CdaS [Anoxybacillus caldiproteolyticus]QPA32840.1 DNA integrity scanning protein DisA nucleotide-binding domain protein [Anoxybacillus caldiproteolyticus]